MTLYPTLRTIICTIYASNSTIFFYRYIYVISLIKIVKLYNFFFIIINSKQKKDPCKAWVKISKVMPLPKSIPPGNGGKPYGKKSKSFVLVWLNHTYYSLLNFTSIIYILFASKFQKQNFSKLGLSDKIQTNSAKSTQFAYILCKLHKIRTNY